MAFFGGCFKVPTCDARKASKESANFFTIFLFLFSFLRSSQMGQGPTAFPAFQVAVAASLRQAISRSIWQLARMEQIWSTCSSQCFSTQNATERSSSLLWFFLSFPMFFPNLWTNGPPPRSWRGRWLAAPGDPLTWCFSSRLGEHLKGHEMRSPSFFANPLLGLFFIHVYTWYTYINWGCPPMRVYRRVFGSVWRWQPVSNAPKAQKLQDNFTQELRTPAATNEPMCKGKRKHATGLNLVFFCVFPDKATTLDESF